MDSRIAGIPKPLTDLPHQELAHHTGVTLSRASKLLEVSTITRAKPAVVVVATGILAVHGTGALIAGLLLVWATATATDRRYR